MTWLKFIYWLSGLYAFYYLGNILWDVSRSKKSAQPAGWTNELTFSEDFKPQHVTAEPAAQAKLPDTVVSPVIDTGGLNLRELFTAAKAETIVYTGGVTY